MGARTNHWFHSDQIYRTFFTLTMLCGCQGVNGGGWAHYVGQEKVRPLAGFQTLAFAMDWQRPTRHMTGTSFFYLHSDQWRYESFGADELASPLGRGLFTGRPFADTLAQASRMGWTPSHPAFDRNPLDLAGEAAAAGQTVTDYVTGELRAGRLRFAGEDPDDPRNFPRVLTVWRANPHQLVAALRDVLAPAATWSWARAPAPTSPRPRPRSRRCVTAAPPPRSGCARGRISRGSSATSSSWTPGWSTSPNGGPARPPTSPQIPAATPTLSQQRAKT
jgi:hypothetical protein